MKELSVVFVALLSCPCKTVNTRFPVLVSLGVYHVQRNSSYCMISPCLAAKPHAQETANLHLHGLFIPGSLWS